MSAIELHEYEEEEELPAWSLPAEAVDRIGVPVTLPDQVTREWALGGRQWEVIPPPAAQRPKRFRFRWPAPPPGAGCAPAPE